MLSFLIWLSLSNEVTIDPGLSTLQISESTTIINFSSVAEYVCILNPNEFMNLNSEYTYMKSLDVRTISGTKTLYIFYTEKPSSNLTFVVLSGKTEANMIKLKDKNWYTINYDFIFLSYTKCDFEYFAINEGICTIRYEEDGQLKEITTNSDVSHKTILNSRYIWIRIRKSAFESSSEYGVIFKQFSENKIDEPEGYKTGTYSFDRGKVYKIDEIIRNIVDRPIKIRYQTLIIFDEKVTAIFHQFSFQKEGTSKPIYVDFDSQYYSEESNTMNNVSYIFIPSSDFAGSWIIATPVNKNSYYSLLKERKYEISNMYNFTDNLNNFNPRLGYNSILIFPDQQVTIVRPDIPKLAFVIPKNEDYFDENNEKIEAYNLNLEHNIIIKASSQARFFEFYLLNMTDVDQYIILFKLPDTITLDHRNLDYKCKFITIFKLGYQFSNVVYGESYPNRYKPGTRHDDHYYVSIDKIYFFPDIHTSYWKIKGHLLDLSKASTSYLEQCKIVDKLLITNIQKNILFDVNKLEISGYDTKTLNNKYDTDLLTVGGPIIIEDPDQYYDENGEKLLYAYAYKEILTISKNSPIFSSSKSEYNINVKAFSGSRNSYVDFIDLSLSKVYYINKKKEDSLIVIVPIIPKNSQINDTYGAYYDFEHYDIKYSDSKDFYIGLDDQYYYNNFIYSSSKALSDIYFSRVDRSRESGMVTCKEFLPYDNLINVPYSGVATISFYYGLVIFPDAENFIQEDGNTLEIRNVIYGEQTYKIKRNPKRLCDHNQLYYVYYPLWEKVETANVVVNHYSEKYNDFLTAFIRGFLNSNIIIVNSLNSTIKSLNSMDKIGNYAYRYYDNENIYEITNTR
ncbi:hypothetical protein TVAG_414130 [Trichomonas vaginalis G3]|uniref:Uncharacterized protein n=1 Tax=Trichomonas vaginalis (strain ATCC PRA-98 / G3) TaxID=412133 RepID=A2EC85_TRIV3|nr:hypothetical protein TVAGG3_0205640 [Trichomonas vaginalis G3]EAY09762.1 hypothetical protein TVAG_414130 [Trichomonas vaginalis G3]KAI5550920.1 hypothetical protein TVAGG3_0205640 [Trichomonas vaginalis G3]|eukprot:XP_001321985.1 hypothetical protein [Trichomonas vaginalis G3]